MHKCVHLLIIWLLILLIILSAIIKRNRPSGNSNLQETQDEQPDEPFLEEPEPETPEPELFVPEQENQLLELHNHQRELNGIPRLEIDPEINEYAQKHAEWMAKQQTLVHSSLNFLRSFYQTGGENIAYGQQNEREVVNAWMNSQGHRDNILNQRFTHVGFGLAYDANGTPYWSACFGGKVVFDRPNVRFFCNLISGFRKHQHSPVSSINTTQIRSYSVP